jgi:hypothetical protein
MRIMKCENNITGADVAKELEWIVRCIPSSKKFIKFGLLDELDDVHYSVPKAYVSYLADKHEEELSEFAEAVNTLRERILTNRSAHNQLMDVILEAFDVANTWTMANLGRFVPLAGNWDTHYAQFASFVGVLKMSIHTMVWHLVTSFVDFSDTKLDNEAVWSLVSSLCSSKALAVVIARGCEDGLKQSYNATAQLLVASAKLDAGEEMHDLIRQANRRKGSKELYDKLDRQIDSKVGPNIDDFHDLLGCVTVFLAAPCFQKLFVLDCICGFIESEDLFFQFVVGLCDGERSLRQRIVEATLLVIIF